MMEEKKNKPGTSLQQLDKKVKMILEQEMCYEPIM